MILPSLTMFKNTNKTVPILIRKKYIFKVFSLNCSAHSKLPSNTLTY